MWNGGDAQCDICGKVIVPVGRIPTFSVNWIEGELTAHQWCLDMFAEACAKQNVELLPLGPLRLSYEAEDGVT